MINRTAFFIGLFLLPLLGWAQQGINFEHVSLEEALSQAQKENKLVFIDFYTDWCAPCKMMANGIFKETVVGDEYNKNYINIKVNAEKEGVQAAKKYGVNAYPTLMFVNKDGDVMYKKVGTTDLDGVLRMSKEALISLKSGSSLADLEKEYPNNRTNEAFLKLYIDKSIQLGSKPYEAIEDYLKVQKSMKPNTSDMLDFYIDKASSMLIGGKAQQILEENFDEFMAICTRNEERTVKQMKERFLVNTRTAALQEKNPEYMKLFISEWKKFEGENDENQDLLVNYQLEYLALSKDYSGYKKLAKHYLDSLVTAKTLNEIKASDKAVYDEYMKKNADDYSISGRGTKQQLLQGKEALEQVKKIGRVGGTYLSIPDNTKADYKQLLKWADYGITLLPDDNTMSIFKGSILYKLGKVKQAIALKESILANMKPGDKKRTVVEAQIENMKKSLKK
jgi:thiol-disulfide isomerase/thioredoxin